MLTLFNDSVSIFYVKKFGYIIFYSDICRSEECVYLEY